jgi:predicted permease
MDIGIRDTDRLLVVSTDAYLAGYTRETGPALVDRLLLRVRALPGVTGAAISSHAPLGFGGSSSQTIGVIGYTPARDENMSINYTRVSDQHLETLGTPLTLGRAITADDRGEGQPAAVVNQAFVDRFFPGKDPLGQRITRARDTAVIIGVVPTGKYFTITEAPTPMIWRPLSQNWASSLTLYVRTTGDPRALVETLRREFASVDPALPFLDPRTMTEQALPATIGQRIGARMLGIFGALALILSALGIYGVMAYTVSLRTREMGIRIALGAGRETVVRMVLVQGARLAVIGLVIGTGLAFGAGTLVRSLLLGVPAGDPLTYAVIGALLLAVALAASAIPALRAARIDPIRALRTE